MIILIHIFCIALIQLSTSQVIQLNPRNSIQGNLVQGNIPNGHNINHINANGLHLTRGSDHMRANNIQLSNLNFVPNTNYNPQVNAMANKLNNAQIVNSELANAKFANLQINNAELANAKLAKAQIANELANDFANSQIRNAEIANAKIANANAEMSTLNYNARLINAEIANNQLVNAELANAKLAQTNELANGRMLQSNWMNKIANPVNYEIVNANLENVAPTSLGNPGLWALNNLASVNGNTATFNIGNGGQMFTITSGSPNSPAFGIQLLAEALEVGGTVAVNGQIPIYGTVTVNGNLPTDGSASVNYQSVRQVQA